MPTIALSCRICNLEDDVRRAIDIDITSGMSPTAIGRKYNAQIARTRPDQRVTKHIECKHVGREPSERAAPDPGTVSATKIEEHRKSVAQRQDEIYEKAFYLVELATKSGDIRGAASCLAQAVTVTGQMKGPEPDKNDAPKESAFWNSYMKRAGEVFNDKQTKLCVEKAHPETRTDAVLVDTAKPIQRQGVSASRRRR